MNKKNILYFLILVAIYCIFINQFYGIDKRVDLLALFIEICVAVIVLILIIRVQKYTFSKKANNFFSFGLMLKFLAQVTI